MQRYRNVPAALKVRSWLPLDWSPELPWLSWNVTLWGPLWKFQVTVVPVLTVNCDGLNWFELTDIELGGAGGEGGGGGGGGEMGSGVPPHAANNIHDAARNMVTRRIHSSLERHAWARNSAAETSVGLRRTAHMND